MGGASVGFLTDETFGSSFSGDQERKHRRTAAVFNPYRYVDWDNLSRYKSNLHCHTKLHKREKDGTIIESDDSYFGSSRKTGFDESGGDVYGSDGKALPDAVIDEYKKYGFDILALTDHDPFYGYGTLQESYGKQTTYPWTLWSRNPQKLGMIAVEGKEFTNPVDYEHDVSLFNNLGGIDQSNGYDRIERLRAVSDNMGLLILAHPRRNVTADQISAQVRRYHTAAAIEVFTRSGRRGTRGALSYWDEVLKQTMPFLPVWGISTDDMHTFDQLGTNWCTHLMSEFNVGAVRHSLVRGEFYVSIDPQGNNLDRHNPVRAPVIDKIEVHDRIITIHSENADHISWISEGDEVSTDFALELETVAVGSYIRAELFGKEDEITCTQPFGILHDCSIR